MSFPKINSMVEFMETLPENERVLVDVLRQILKETLPVSCKERFAYNVPFYYGKRRICLIWPASVPRGGIREGVLFGFCYGHRLQDADRYLDHGSNKQVYYKIFYQPSDIDEAALRRLIAEALKVDQQHP